MIQTLFLGLILASPNLFAISFVRENNDLFLTDQNCQYFENTLSSIKSWAASLNNNECQIEIQNQKNMNCKARIKGCLPLHIENVLGKTPSKAGPNCHNFAFTSAGISCSIRQANYKEAVDVYNSHLCEILKADETLKPGDIGRIGHSMFSAHSFVHLTDDQILSKNGEAISEYNLFSIEYVLTAYGVSNSKNCKEAKFRKCPSCPDGAEYYRCKSFEQYLKENKVALEYLNANEQLKKFEGIAECRAFGDSVQSFEVNNLLSDNLILLNKYLDDSTHKILLNKDSSTEELFLLKNLMDRLDSLRDQFSMFDPGLNTPPDYSHNNLDKKTGLPISEKLNGHWQNEIQKKIQKLENKDEPSFY